MKNCRTIEFIRESTVSPIHIILGLLILVWLLLIVHHLIVVIGFPYPISYPEGVVASGIERLAVEGELYPPVGSNPPWLHTPYPPVFFLFSQLPGKLGANSLLSARLVSSLAFIFAIIAVIRLSRGCGGKEWAGVAGLLFAASPVVLGMAGLAQVDMTGLAFSLWALLALQQRHWSYSISCGLLCALALLTKPAFVAVPLICLITTAGRGKGSILLFLLSLGGAGILVFWWGGCCNRNSTHCFTCSA